MDVQLFYLKDNVNVHDALKLVHQDFTGKNVSAARLNSKLWIKVLPVDGAFKMIPGKFHVVQISGIVDVRSLMCTFDPMLTGLVLDSSKNITITDTVQNKSGESQILHHQFVSVGQEEWLNYRGFSTEELGRYNSGDSKGYLFKASPKLNNEIRILHCEDARESTNYVEAAIGY